MAEQAEESTSFVNSIKLVARRIFKYENTMLVIILAVIMAAVGVMTKGLTLSIHNMLNVWIQSATRGIAAIGQLFCLLSAGLDLSVGGIALMVTILGASLMTHQTHISVAAIGAMLVVGIGIGALNGVLISRIGMSAVIVTLAMWQITRGFAYMMSKGYSFHDLPGGLNFFGAGHIAGAPVPIIIFAAVAVVGYFVLNHTSFGRSVYAVGGNPVSAWLSGINIKNMQFAMYVISGSLAALAGFIIMARTMAGGMSSYVTLELDSIAAAVIGGVSLGGGRGTVIGVVLGVLILSVIDNGMNVYGLDPSYKDLVKGAIIIGAVAADYLRRR